MNILNPKFKYYPAAEHSDPNYLRRRFEEIAGPNWMKKPAKRRQPKAAARGAQK